MHVSCERQSGSGEKTAHLEEKGVKVSALVSLRQ